MSLQQLDEESKRKAIGELFVQLDTFRKEKYLCDCVLKSCDGLEYEAHKVVVAIQSKRLELELEQKSEVIVEGIDGKLLGKLVEWLYTGSMDGLHSMQLLVLLNHGIQWEMDHFQNSAIQLLLSRDLQGQEALECWSYADGAQLPKEVQEHCHKMVSYSFENLQSESFVDLNEGQMVKLLGSDHLNAPDEAVTWQAVKTWIDHDKNNRASSLPVLLKTIRLEHMTMATFQNDVTEFCQQHLDTKLIQEAQTFFDVNRNMEQMQAQPRFASQMVLVMVTGPDGGMMYSYDWKAGLWQHVREVQVPMHSLTLVTPPGPNVDELVILNYSTAIQPFAFNLKSRAWRELSTLNMPWTGETLKWLYHKGKLRVYTSDGHTEEYDAKRNQWFASQFMGQAEAERGSLVTAGFISVNDHLYIIGGMADDQVKADIRVLNEERGTLDIKAQMRTPRCYPQATTWGSKVVIWGGYAEIFNDALASVEVYDPLTNTLETLPPLDIFTANTGFIGSLGSDRLLAIESYPGHNTAFPFWRVRPSTRQVRLYDKKSGTNAWLPQTPLTLDRPRVIRGMTVIHRHQLELIHRCNDQLYANERQRAYLALRKLQDETQSQTDSAELD